jgi:hypothetical protein
MQPILMVVPGQSKTRIARKVTGTIVKIGNQMKSKFQRRLARGKPMFNNYEYDWHVRMWRQHQFNNQPVGKNEWWSGQ